MATCSAAVVATGAILAGRAHIATVIKPARASPLAQGLHESCNIAARGAADGLGARRRPTVGALRCDEARARCAIRRPGYSELRSATPLA